MYRGQVLVPADKPHVVLRGLGADPAQRGDRRRPAPTAPPSPAAAPGAPPAAPRSPISGSGFTARHLTFANLFDEAAHPEITDRQAVAVLTRADRLVFDNVRFLGNQDTLDVNSPDVDRRQRGPTSAGAASRATSTSSSAGRTAVFDRCELRSLQQRLDDAPTGTSPRPSTERRRAVRLRWSYAAG